MIEHFDYSSNFGYKQAINSFAVPAYTFLNFNRYSAGARDYIEFSCQKRIAIACERVSGLLFKNIDYVQVDMDIQSNDTDNYLVE